MSGKPPPTIWIPEHLARDPGMLDHVLDEMCRLYLEEGQPIPEEILPALALRFRNYLAHVEAGAKRGGRGSEGPARAMNALVMLNFPEKQAREIVAKAAGIEPESVEREYRRFLKRTNRERT